MHQSLLYVVVWFPQTRADGDCVHTPAALQQVDYLCASPCDCHKVYVVGMISMWVSSPCSPARLWAMTMMLMKATSHATLSHVVRSQCIS